MSASPPTPDVFAGDAQLEFHNMRAAVVGAVVLAWHGRADALRRQMRTRGIDPGYGRGYAGAHGWMAS